VMPMSTGTSWMIRDRQKKTIFMTNKSGRPVTGRADGAYYPGYLITASFSE
jgi:hypothetical protein